MTTQTPVPAPVQAPTPVVTPTNQPVPTPAPQSLAPISPPPAPTPSGSNTATTTRYWDCSGGACGCAYLPGGAGTDSDPAHCHSNAMFAAPTDNEHGATYYGAAAISRFLWDGNTNSGDWLGEGCGKCWKVTGSSNVGNNQGVSTTLVLKGTNICPTGICNENGKAHFDIAAPGFDVLEYSWSNTCKELEADELEGFESCGRWMIDNQVPSDNCDCSKFHSPVLQAGCENFYALQWDNPAVTYEEVNCPPEIDSLPCFGDHGSGYPQDGIPETCMDPHGDPNGMLPFPGASPITPPPTPTSTPPPPTTPTTPTTTPPAPAPTSFPPILCPEGYETARWTWYISYPKCCPDQPHYDPNAPTEECDVYNGCAWDGDFAYVGHRPYEYVANTDIIAFFATGSNNADYGKKVMRVYSPAHNKMVEAALVLDTCGDADCDGCCTTNANTGGGFLVDMEENTVLRHFGALSEADGLVCFQVIPDDEYDAGGYCSWSGCADGNSAQGGWNCNLNKYECETTCGGGTWCMTTQTPVPAPVQAPTPVVTPTNQPVPALAPQSPTDSPTELAPTSCIPCTDEETPYMKKKGKYCSSSNGSIKTKCNKANNWVVNKYCQFSCFMKGNGYAGDNCCDEPLAPGPTPIVTPTNQPVPGPTSQPVLQPTVQPVPAPTGGTPCCTWNVKTCSDNAWCNQSESNCKNSCGGPHWLDVSGCPSDGIGLGSDCTTNQTKCCPGLMCASQSEWYYRCELQ